MLDNRGVRLQRFYYTYHQRYLLSGFGYVHEVYTQGQNEEYLLTRSVY